MIHEIIGRKTLARNIFFNIILGIKGPEFKKSEKLKNPCSPGFTHTLGFTQNWRPKKCQSSCWLASMRSTWCLPRFPGFIPMGILMALWWTAVHKFFAPPHPKKKRKSNYFQLFEQTIRQHASTVKNVCSARCKHKSWCIEFDANMLIHSLTLTVARATQQVLLCKVDDLLLIQHLGPMDSTDLLALLVDFSY